MLEQVLAKLEGVKPKGNGGHMARCPLHDDREASLSVDVNDAGRVLVKCFAGCDQRALARHLFNGNGNGTKREAQRPVAATYGYYDEDGEMLFQVVRRDGKKFTQRRLDGAGTWAYHLGPCDDKRPACRKGEHAPLKHHARMVLYNLPDVLDAAKQGGTVWIVEGEKDADSIGRAGEVATTSPGGAGKWDDEYADALKGAHVVVCPDNDKPGERHAEAIVASIERRRIPYRRVTVPEPHKDVSDYLAAGGDLAALVAAQPAVAAPDDTTPLTVPTLAPEALYGPAGAWVVDMEPYTEASPVALLLSLLTGLGAMIGPGPVVEVSPGEVHGPRLFVCIVGKSGMGRKGTSWSNVRHLLRAIDADFVDVRGDSAGFGSGEAFIDAIENPDGHDEDEDDGDRRLLVVDTEMGATIRTIERQGSNLGHQLRKAWDGSALQTHSRGHGSRVLRQHHVAMIGHITPHDLATVKVEDLMNGFAGRFLYVYVERARVLSGGNGMPAEQTTAHARTLSLAVDRARTRGTMVRDPGADALYRPWYEAMRTDYDEPLDALMARAPNHLMRLALIYALLDGAPAIRAEHMTAALAVWAYCEACLHLLYGPRGLIASARRRINATEADLAIVYNAIVAAGPEGLTIPAIAAILGGAPAPLLAAHLHELEARGMVVPRRSTKGPAWAGKEVLKNAAKRTR